MSLILSGIKSVVVWTVEDHARVVSRLVTLLRNSSCHAEQKGFVVADVMESRLVTEDGAGARVDSAVARAPGRVRPSRSNHSYKKPVEKCFPGSPRFLMALRAELAAPNRGS